MVPAMVWAANITPAAQGCRHVRTGCRAACRVVGQNTMGRWNEVGHHDEMRGLVGGVAVDRPGHHLWLIGDDRDRVAAQMGQGTDDSGEYCTSNQSGRSRYHVHDAPDVVHPPVVTRDDVHQLGRGPRTVIGRPCGWIRPRAGREIGQIAPDLVERGGVVVGQIVDHPAGQPTPGRPALSEMSSRSIPGPPVVRPWRSRRGGS